MKIKFLLFFLLFPITLSAQQGNNIVDKPQRKVFLWDVTLSMKGAGGCPNIWDEVKGNLIKEIEKISDPKIEIVILPFQHRIIENKTAFATPEGKYSLIQYVKDYDLPRLWVGDAKTGHEAKAGEKGKTTMTKLYYPLQECLSTVISDDKIDLLVFLTDGVSDFPDDQADFENFICNDWCEAYAEEKDIYAYYLMLTDNATHTRSCECKRFKPVTMDDETDISTIFLTPANSVVYNIKDDFGKAIEIKFDTKTTTPLGDGFLIHVESRDNPYFNIDQDVVLDSKRNVISIQPVAKLGRDEMRNLIYNKEDNKDFIYLNITAGPGMKEKYDRVIVSEKKTEVELLGIDERVLTLDWK